MITMMTTKTMTPGIGSTKNTIRSTILNPSSYFSSSLLLDHLNLIQARDGDSLLHLAIIREDVSWVKYLCEVSSFSPSSPEDVSSTSSRLCPSGSNDSWIDCLNHLLQSPLHLACVLGNDQIVSILVHHRVRINVRDRNGNNCLHLLLLHSNSSHFTTSRFISLQLILSTLNNNHHSMFDGSKSLSHGHGNVHENGKDADNADVYDTLNGLNHEGLSPLHLAACSKWTSSDKKKVIEMLVQAGADLNVTDGRSGRTALLSSTLAGDHAMVQYLLTLGADPLVPDYSDLKPVDIFQLSNPIT